jgi:hypothetical protein
MTAGGARSGYPVGEMPPVLKVDPAPDDTSVAIDISDANGAIFAMQRLQPSNPAR